MVNLSKKINVPKGLLNWSLDLELEDEILKNTNIFAKKCTHDITRIALQFKINTQILPTNEYLHRYRVLNENTCSFDLCGERDTTLHSLWDCNIVQQFITVVFSFLDDNCSTTLVNGANTMQGYIFGFIGKGEALNQILLELKHFNFYFLHENPTLNAETLKNIFLYRIRKIMYREKVIAIGNGNYDCFEEKWSIFSNIYDFRGPDVDFVG